MDLNIYKIALATHIIGITIMAGTTFIDYIIFQQFRKVFTTDKPKSLLMEDILNKLQIFIGIGMLGIILSGVLMMVYMHQVWGQQVWFRIKMGILILIIINGFAFRRRLGLKLKKLLERSSGNGLTTELSRVKGNITLVQILQMLFFITIFVLSVFKFN